MEIKTVARDLADLPTVDALSLTRFVRSRPESVPVLGLVVGLSQEKLKNALKHNLNTTGWVKLARTEPDRIIEMLDAHYELIRLLEMQRRAIYEFGDVLVARAGSKVTAAGGQTAGRLVEDAIEAVATELRLPFALRTRFVGRDNLNAPADLAIPAGGKDALIVVAAKGFDSTGSKLGDAVREVEEMARIRQARQFVMAVVDGIGWLSRGSDLAKIFALYQSQQIDGMYTLDMLDDFASDLEDAARRLRLL
jgi:hypothetical protein